MFAYLATWRMLLTCGQASFSADLPRQSCKHQASGIILSTTTTWTKNSIAPILRKSRFLQGYLGYYAHDHLGHDVRVWMAEQLVYDPGMVQQSAQTHQYRLV